jgi:hypothetical protein
MHSSGKYLIAIKYGNINIAGSPYVAEITGINLNIDYIFILLFLMMFDLTRISQEIGFYWDSPNLGGPITRTPYRSLYLKSYIF